MKVIPYAAIIILWFFHFAATEAQTVIIVGAGISGILAAQTLQQNGIVDFLILEADERIAGRLLKKEFQGHTVELGAGSISSGGPIGSVLVDIANKISLKTYTSGVDDISSYTYDQEGDSYGRNIVEKAIRDSRTVADRSKEYLEILSKPSSYTEDLDTSILAAQEFYQKVPATPLEMVIDFYHNDYQDGDPPKYTSMKHTYPHYEAEDFGKTTHFVRDDRGFESIAHYIAGEFLLTANGVITDPRLKLRTTVTEIQHISGGVAIITENGTVYNSRFVIVSVSIGVLQANLIKFSPELPPLRRIAISDFRMAAYTQIFLKFPSTFWRVGPGTEVFLYADKNRGFYPLWRHLSNEFHGSNILTVTVTDVEAKRIESQSDEDTKMEIMIVLRKIFGDHIPNPQEILVPKWFNNKLYMGSFANWPSRFSLRSHDLLREPYGPIYFTGEHLSSKYIGSVIGAYYEGIRTAEDVTKQIIRG